MIIDAHHHFWRYTPAEYGWIGPDQTALRHDFLPQNLKSEIAVAGIDGVISVQARQTLVETRWLLDLAAQNQFMRGVVGWVPLASSDVAGSLAELSQNKKLRGVRHVIHDEPDDQFILGKDFNRGISQLEKFNLRYDILIFQQQLPLTTKFVDLHPRQIFILDHIAKPRIKAGELDPWQRNLRELAKRPNVYCKISGMTTEADWTGNASDMIKAERLRPYLDIVLNAFTPRQLMFGSDWPVCTLACSYVQWAHIVRDWAAALSTDERERLFAGTAIEAYQLDEEP